MVQGLQSFLIGCTPWLIGIMLWAFFLCVAGSLQYADQNQAIVGVGTVILGGTIIGYVLFMVAALVTLVYHYDPMLVRAMVRSSWFFGLPVVLVALSGVAMLINKDR